MTWDEAKQFAESLGGRLPMPDEWDHAAGCTERRSSSLTLPNGKPRVNSAQPGPLPGNDVNDVGLRDMAGNGREWTNEPFEVPGVEGTFAIVRGKCYTFEHA